MPPPESLQPAQDLRADPIPGGTSVDVRWQRPPQRSDSKVILSYYFRLFRRRKESSNKEWKLLHQGKDFTSYVAENLQPYSEYEFYVQTYNLSTDGPKSVVVSVRTNQLPPSDPPQLRVSHVGLDTIAIAWSPPSKINGVLQGYRLFYDQAGQSEYNEVEIPPSQTTFVARHLYKNTIYRFQILAFTAAGEGPHSIMCCPRTMSDAVTRFLNKGEEEESAPNIEQKHSISGREQVVIPDLPPSPSAPRREMFAAGRPSLRAQPPAPKSQAPAPVTPQKQTEEKTPVKRRVSMDDWQIRRQQALEAEKGDKKGVSFLGEESESSTDGPPAGASGSEPRRRSGFSIFAPSPQAEDSKPASEKKVFNTASLRVGKKDALWQRSEDDEGRNAWSEIKKPIDLGVGKVSSGVKIESNVGDDIVLDLSLQELLSGKGTIRGKRNGVRSKLEVLTDRGKIQELDLLSRLYQEERHGKIVVYMTSVQAVRATKQRCDDLLKIFHNLRLKVHLKDISMDAETARELEERRPGSQVPQVYVNGTYFGDSDQVRAYAETHQLEVMLEGFEERALEDCRRCGGRGWVNCSWCQGSKRSLHNPFEQHDMSKRALRCTVCNEVGLERCPEC